MRTIAILLTCHNRKEKTLDSLKHLIKAGEESKSLSSYDIYLTDDGSIDGTSEAVKENYPAVHILQGNGSLYWAGGMRKSWNAALKKKYDGYLLLNDDTYMYKNALKILFETNNYCNEKYGKGGVYIGSTLDKKTGKRSYGGAVVKNKFLQQFEHLEPINRPQNCELGNANMMLVSVNVVNTIGILGKKFTHAFADWDYTLKANRNDFPVLVAPNYLGECINDSKSPHSNFHQLSLKERFRSLYSPKGLDIKSNLYFMGRNFPYRVPFVLVAGYFKVFFPKLYIWKIRRI